MYGFSSDGQAAAPALSSSPRQLYYGGDGLVSSTPRAPPSSPAIDFSFTSSPLVTNQSIVANPPLSARTSTTNGSLLSYSTSRRPQAKRKPAPPMQHSATVAARPQPAPFLATGKVVAALPPADNLFSPRQLLLDPSDDHLTNASPRLDLPVQTNLTLRRPRLNTSEVVTPRRILAASPGTPRLIMREGATTDFIYNAAASSDDLRHSTLLRSQPAAPDLLSSQRRFLLSSDARPPSATASRTMPWTTDHSHWRNALPTTHKRREAKGDVTARSVVQTPSSSTATVTNFPYQPLPSLIHAQRQSQSIRNIRDKTSAPHDKLQSNPQDVRQSFHDKKSPSAAEYSSSPPATHRRARLADPLNSFISTRESLSHIDNYDTIAMIGQGGYAVVRVAQHRACKKIFVLKQIAKSDFTNVQQLRMAYTEMDLLHDASMSLSESSRRRASLTSTKRVVDANSKEERKALIRSLVARVGPSYFPVFFGGWHDDHFIYFIMEYLPGGDLMKHLIDKEIFPEQMSKFYTAQIAIAIGYMHDSLRYVHRDIKPDNVLFDASGHSKVVDFGLSRKLPPPQYDEKGNVIFVEAFTSAVGTPDYMAPEVHRAGVAHDRTIDWWSLGIILYEMLFGGPPLSDLQHRAEVTSRLIRNWKSFLSGWPSRPPVSDLAKDLINKLIAEKEDRLQTVEEVLSHPWFHDLDLDNLRSLKPPILPKLTSPADVQNFDSFSMKRLLQWEEKKKSQSPSSEVIAFLSDMRHKFSSNVSSDPRSMLMPGTAVPDSRKRMVRPATSGAASSQPSTALRGPSASRRNPFTKAETSDAGNAPLSSSTRPSPPARRPVPHRFTTETTPNVQTVNPPVHLFPEPNSARGPNRNRRLLMEDAKRKVDEAKPSTETIIPVATEVRSSVCRSTPRNGMAINTDNVSTVSSGIDPPPVSSASSNVSHKQQPKKIQLPPSQIASASTETVNDTRMASGSSLLSGIKGAVSRWLTTSTSGNTTARQSLVRDGGGVMWEGVYNHGGKVATGTQIGEVSSLGSSNRRRLVDLRENVQPGNK